MPIYWSAQATYFLVQCPHRDPVQQMCSASRHSQSARAPRRFPRPRARSNETDNAPLPLLDSLHVWLAPYGVNPTGWISPQSRSIDCGEPASPERDRGEIDRTVQLLPMDRRAGQPARSRDGRIPSATWALDLLGGLRRVERGAARFFDVLGGNSAAPPAAGAPAIRNPGWPPSNGNFSWDQAMWGCAGELVDELYMRMRHDTRAESTIKEPPEPPNPSNRAHITRHLP